jgi:hypothetical protein
MTRLHFKLGSVKFNLKIKIKIKIIAHCQIINQKSDSNGQFLIKIGFNLTVLFLNFVSLIYLFKPYVLHCIVFFNQ